MATSKTSGSKWALVYWMRSRQFSVLKEQFVPNKRMLSDPALKDYVEYGDHTKKPPNGGWKKFEARVLRTGYSKEVLERSALDIISGHGLPVAGQERTSAKGNPAANSERRVISPDQTSSSSSGESSSESTDESPDNAGVKEIKACVMEAIKRLDNMNQNFLNFKNTVESALTAQAKLLESLKQEVQSARRDAKRHKGSSSAAEGSSEVDPVKVALLKEAENKLGSFMPGGKEDLILAVHLAKDSLDALGNIANAIFTEEEFQTRSVKGRGKKEGLDFSKRDALYRFAALKYGFSEKAVEDILRGKIKYSREKTAKVRRGNEIPPYQVSIPQSSFEELFSSPQVNQDMESEEVVEPASSRSKPKKSKRSKRHIRLRPLPSLFTRLAAMTVASSCILSYTLSQDVFRVSSAPQNTAIQFEQEVREAAVP